MHNPSKFCFLLALLLFPLAKANSDANSLIILDPIVVETPPGATVTAAYLSMSNETDKDIVINGAYSTSVRKVEIHESKIENDVAKMVQKESITIKPGEMLKMEHGATHLMLMNLDEPLLTGERVEIIFQTSVGDLLVDIPVMRPGAGAHAAKNHETVEHGNISADGETENALEAAHSKDENHSEDTMADKAINAE